MSSLDFCQLISRLSEIELSANQLGVQSVIGRLDEFGKEAEAAGFQPDEFRLYRQLRTWLQTESDVKGQVAAKLSSEELFPPDPKQTNILRLQEELAVARRGQHPAYAQLVGALEARAILHQECMESGASSLEARKLLLLAVSTTRHVRPADKAIADMRLKEVERLETATQDQRNRIARSAAKADTQTLESFGVAWNELEEALKINADSLIGEIRSAQMNLRKQMAVKAQALVVRYSDAIPDDKIASEIRQWIALAAKTGAGEAERVLEGHFNRFLWEWDAHHGSLEERLRALLRLSHLDGQRWHSQLVEVGLQLALREMEEYRKKLEQGEQLDDATDQSLVTRHPELRSPLETSAAYLRKLAELSVWRREMSNARHYAEQAAKLDQPSIGSGGLILSQSEATSLLEYAEFREQIETLLDDGAVPRGDHAQRLQSSYQRLFRSERQTPAEP
jgi:hypothetical protein